MHRTIVLAGFAALMAATTFPLAPPARAQIGNIFTDPVPRPPEDAGKPGFVNFATTPSGLQVTVDGTRKVGKTPLKKLKLSPGSHVLTFTANGAEQNVAVWVTGGETLNQTWEAPKPPPPTRKGSDEKK